MSNAKEKLIRKLKQAVSEQEKAIADDEQACRVSCGKILQFIDDFFESWEEDLDDHSAFPVDFLRQTIFKIGRRLGHGNSLLRRSLWASLRSAITPECRQILFDFLPITMPQHESKDLNCELLEIMDHVFERDASALPQILECVSGLGRSACLGQHDIFEFLIQILGKVSERRIHVVVGCLIECITDEKEAKIVAEAIRTEQQPVEDLESEESVSCTSKIAEVLVLCKDSDHGTLLFEAYLSLLEEFVRNMNEVSHSSPEERQGRILALDMVVLLIHHDSFRHCENVERIFDMAFAGLNVPLSKFSLLFCAILGLQETNEAASQPTVGDDKTITSDHLVFLSTFLLLTPIRLRNLSNVKEVSNRTKEVISKLLLTLEPVDKGTLVSSLLSLDDELSCNGGIWNGPTTPIDERRKHSLGVVPIIRNTIFVVFAEVAKECPEALVPFKQILIKKLHSPNDMGSLSDGAVENLCVVVSYIYEFIQKQVDGSQKDPVASLTVRSLLFSPSDALLFPGDSDVDRCTRGLRLAVQLIFRGHLCNAQIIALWKSVKAVLLPPSGRLVNPKVGSHGLKFIRAYHYWTTTGKNRLPPTTISQQILQTLTHVLSNSRVVQYERSYEDRKCREQSFLAYAERPSFFEAQIGMKKHRKMIFCFDAFFRDEFFTIPSNWNVTSQWLFHLVDTYLSIGRYTSEVSPKGNWNPNPWVEAAIEFPLVDLSQLKPKSIRQQRSLDFLRKELSNAEFSCGDSFSDAFDKDISDMIQNLSKKQESAYLIRSVYRSGLSLLLSSALSAAVLRNTYERFKYALEWNDFSSVIEEKHEANRLLQYQLFKFYDLQRKCHSMQRILRALNIIRRTSTKRGRKRKRGKEGRGTANLESNVS